MPPFRTPPRVQVAHIAERRRTALNGVSATGRGHGHCPQRLATSTRASQAAQGFVLPADPRGPSAYRPGAVRGGDGGLRRWRVHPLGRRPGRRAGHPPGRRRPQRDGTDHVPPPRQPTRRGRDARQPGYIAYHTGAHTQHSTTTSRPRTRGSARLSCTKPNSASPTPTAYATNSPASTRRRHRRDPVFTATVPFAPICGLGPERVEVSDVDVIFRDRSRVDRGRSHIRRRLHPIFASTGHQRHQVESRIRRRVNSRDKRGHVSPKTHVLRLQVCRAHQITQSGLHLTPGHKGLYRGASSRPKWTPVPANGPTRYSD